MFVYNLQGLIETEKVNIDCEKVPKLANILANKTATQWWPNIIIKESKQTTLHLFLFSCDYDLIKKMKLPLMVVSVLLKIKFGHAQISVLKISIYTDVENTLYQPMISYQLSSIIACFFLWYTQL